MLALKGFQCIYLILACESIPGLFGGEHPNGTKKYGHMKERKEAGAPCRQPLLGESCWFGCGEAGLGPKPRHKCKPACRRHML